MTAAYLDQDIQKGTTFISQIELTDNNGSPVPLGNFNIKSQAKRNYTSNAVINFETSYVDASNGIIQLLANSAVTANLTVGKLVYDVFLEEIATGVITKIIEGQLMVIPSATTNI